MFRHRKALLQHLARDLAPTVDPYLRMHDWVAGVGGPVLATMVDQLYLDDQGLGDTLDVLSQSAFAWHRLLSWRTIACMLWWACLTAARVLWTVSCPTGFGVLC